MTKPILIVGHKNPDTDSICSAIAYARLKSRLEQERYIPRRAGAVNEETRYILQRFGVEEPRLLENLEPRVSDVQLNYVKGILPDVTLHEAWNSMQSSDTHTLPVLRNRRLLGVVTLGDIARSYFNDPDGMALSAAAPSYQAIAQVLDGTIRYGRGEARFSSGRVLAWTEGPGHKEPVLEAGDLVILSGDGDAQRMTIDEGAGCLILCQGRIPSSKTMKLAREKQCVLITTPYDMYAASRLINQAIPVGHIMRTEGLVIFDVDDPISEIKCQMARHRFRYYPILDSDGIYLGLLSQRQLLDLAPRKVILVDHNERSQAVDGVLSAEILEIIDHHRLGNIETMQPVFFRNQPLGSTATIVAQMYQEQGIQPDSQTAALLLSAVLSDTLMFQSPTCTPLDRITAKQLAALAQVDYEELAMSMFKAGSHLSSKSAEEIFQSDFKTFQFDGMQIGIGQVSSVIPEELQQLEEEIYAQMLREKERRKLDLVLFMLTNILTASTVLLFAGAGSINIVEKAFQKTADNHKITLEGMLSRKKQLVPAVMNAISRLSE